MPWYCGCAYRLLRTLLCQHAFDARTALELQKKGAVERVVSGQREPDGNAASRCCTAQGGYQRELALEQACTAAVA